MKQETARRSAHLPDNAKRFQVMVAKHELVRLELELTLPATQSRGEALERQRARADTGVPWRRCTRPRELPGDELPRLAIVLFFFPRLCCMLQIYVWRVSNVVEQYYKCFMRALQK